MILAAPERLPSKVPHGFELPGYGSFIDKKLVSVRSVNLRNFEIIELRRPAEPLSWIPGMG
jgi:hypothetical protein